MLHNIIYLQNKNNLALKHLTLLKWVCVNVVNNIYLFYFFN